MEVTTSPLTARTYSLKTFSQSLLIAPLLPIRARSRVPIESKYERNNGVPQMRPSFRSSMSRHAEPSRGPFEFGLAIGLHRVTLLDHEALCDARLPRRGGALTVGSAFAIARRAP